MSISGYVECGIRRRLNRFVVEVYLSGRTEHAHINNTGRLLELLVEGKKAALSPDARRENRIQTFAIGEEAGWAQAYRMAAAEKKPQAR